MASVVSLLMTDIVGSTRLWVEDEAAMSADLAAHDELVGGVVRSQGGRVFKHTGDGIIAVFDDVGSAAAAGIRVQREIGGAAWRAPGGLKVRAAVHSGVVLERDGDLFGTSVNRVARLLGACPSGAALVSAVTAALLAERASDEFEVRSVGTLHLRGFARPEAVYALVADDLEVPDAVADAGTTDRAGSNLPPIDDDLIGRTAELAAVWEAVRAHHLVTLVGVGGMGKTRLALEAAAGIAHEFRGNVWWVDLSAATSDEAVLPVMLAEVGGREVQGRTLLESLVDQLAGREALVVIDNCEHVLRVVRDVVAALRAGCADVRILATSREALDVRGEQPIAVGSMPIDDAVELFVERAETARPGLVTGDDRAEIVAICEQVDGIPLAIELAAARCRSMSPGEIQARLADRFRLLRGGRSSAERHRTLQAAVGWSYSLLDDDERDMFDRMSVFSGGTLIDGLAAVCELDEYDALDIVDRLIARSMVTVGGTPLGTRYRQLETLRQYAEDRLAERAVIAEVRDRHLDWIIDVATWIHSTLGHPDAEAAFARYVEDFDNIRVAVAHAVDGGRTGQACAVVSAVWGPAFIRPSYEVLDWFDPLESVPPWTQAAVDTVSLHGLLAYFRGDATALSRAADAVPESVRLGSIAMLCAFWAALFPGRIDDAAVVLDAFVPNDGYERRLALWCRINEYNYRAIAGASPEAIHAMVAHAADIVAEVRSEGNDVELATTLNMFSFLLSAVAQVDEARAAATESLSIYERHRAGLGADSARQAISAAQELATAGPSRVAAAKDLRRFVLDAMEHGSLYPVKHLVGHAGRMLWEDEPRTAYLLHAYLNRELLMVTLPGEPEAVLGAAVTDELDRRAESMTLDDAIEISLDALERLIAADDGNAASTGTDE